MANLTIVVDDQLLQAARIKALKEGTSVNEICRQAIARFARPEDDAAEFVATLRAIARRARPVPKGEPIWPGREALYKEMLAHRMHGRLPDLPDLPDAPASPVDPTVEPKKT